MHINFKHLNTTNHQLYDYYMLHLCN